jgi:aspartate aminotransferase
MTSKRVESIGESATMKIAGKAIEMKRNGEDIIDFSAGEPDFPTPDNIKEAAKKALDLNQTKYSANAGLYELRQAVSNKILREYSADIPASSIIISTGAKQALLNTVLALIDPGDEVIIPAPYYVSYPEMVKLAGGIPVIANTSQENSFKLQPGELEAAITPNTKAFIICNPCNPTGTAYTFDELKALADILTKNNIYVISDEVYEKLIYDGLPFASFISAAKGMEDRVVIINGVSKAYAMTGWRIGYAACKDKRVFSACDKLQSHITSGACTISQYAALEALTGDQSSVEIMSKEFEARRDYVFGRIQNMPAVTCCKPQGAFYIFPNISELIKQHSKPDTFFNSATFCQYILHKSGTVLVPGSGFGYEDFFRLSFSSSIENLGKGIDRIVNCLEKL